MMRKIEIESGLTDEQVTNLFNSSVGTLTTKSPARVKREMAKRCRILVELYPRVVEQSKAYVKWKGLTKQLTPEEAEEHAQQKAEDEANKPFDLCVADKYRHLYKSAMKRDKDFDLSLADVRKMMLRKTCHYTGVKLTTTSGDPFQRTIDRIDNTRGYVKGNVVACSHSANHIKNRLFEDPTSDISINIKHMKRLIEKMEESLT